MGDLPQGTVTFLFSDVEGSTKLLEEHGALTGSALARHHEIFEEVVGHHGGAIFETVGDAVYAAFAAPTGAVGAALDVHRRLAEEDWGPLRRMAVRVALHTGQVEARGAHYFGSALFRAARLLALAHGEQTLLSGVTARLVADALPDRVTLVDLGLHRLKDLGEPEHVYQLAHPELRDAFPALRSLDQVPHNLPNQLSGFVGRERELDQLGHLLAEHHLITLLGPGGIGKTRLALQGAADNLERFPDGAWFVDLSPLRDASLLPAAVASALGLRENPGVSLAETVAEFFRPRSLLLLLDNLEQLLPDASEVIAGWARAAPDIRVLTTSRAPLRIRGEHEVVVPPLSSGSPDAADPEAAPAVMLFLERARSVQPDLALTPETGPLMASITRRVDGLPLAIELAAARLRLFSMAELDRRLAQRLPVLASGARDLPVRQRTLRATIAWSDELLPPAEKALFARLGVFSGTFTTSAVEAVAGGDADGDALAGLEALIEQSLVTRVEVRGESRYAMLETIREYASNRLQESDAAATARDNHASFLIGVVSEASPHFRGPGGPQWLDAVERWYPDIRSALAFLEERDDVARLSQLIAGCAAFWRLRGPASEGLTWLNTLITDVRSPVRARAVALRHASTLNLDLGNSALAYEQILRSAELFESDGDEAGLADALMALGNQQMASGRREGAERSLRRALELGTKHGMTSARLGALGNLALLALADDRLEESLAMSLAVQEESAQAGDLFSVAMSAGNVSAILVDLDRPADAIAPAETAVAAMRELGDVTDLAWALSNLGQALLRAGDSEGAAEALAEGMRHTDDTGSRWNLIPLLTVWAELALSRSDFRTAVLCLAVGERCARELEYEAAPFEVRANERLANAARSALGAEPFDQLWASAATTDPFDLARQIRHAVD